jgi:hypothetical protein
MFSDSGMLSEVGCVVCQDSTNSNMILRGCWMLALFNVNGSVDLPRSYFQLGVAASC